MYCKKNIQQTKVKKYRKSRLKIEISLFIIFHFQKLFISRINKNHTIH